MAQETESLPPELDEASEPVEGSAEQPGVPSQHPVRPEPTRYGDWEKGGRCIDF
jgi:hypothetical protein